MYVNPDSLAVSETDVITVRYWASARAACGVSTEDIPSAGLNSLADLIATLVDRHPGTQVRDVLGVCSILLGDEQVSSRDPAKVELRAGQSVEFLPPFAGG
jgi:sulfur-carrier protein